jgi:hypothetical protein
MALTVISFSQNTASNFAYTLLQLYFRFKLLKNSPIVGNFAFGDADTFELLLQIYGVSVD